MSVTTRDILLDADAFRRAEPNWPLPLADPEAHRCGSCGHLPGCDCACCGNEG